MLVVDGNSLRFIGKVGSEPVERCTRNVIEELKSSRMKYLAMRMKARLDLLATGISTSNIPKQLKFDQKDSLTIFGSGF